MIKALIFDCFGVIIHGTNQNILDDIRVLRKHYKTAILSNTSSTVFFRFFPGDTSKEYFDELIFSYDEGITKPNSKIYLMAAQKLKVKPNECIFIDDSEDNIKGAEAIGMIGVLYRDEENFKHQLRELGIDI